MVHDVTIDSRNYKRQAVLWGFALPPVALAAKTLLWSPLVTLLLATHAFHAASLFKAHAGSRYFGRMLSERRVVWTPSEALTAFLHGPRSSPEEDGSTTLQSVKDNTLTDEQLKALEETLGLSSDLSRSYRSASLESWMSTYNK